MSRQSQHTLTKYSFVLQWFEDSIYRYQIVSLTLQSTQVAIIRRPICEMLVNGASPPIKWQSVVPFARLRMSIYYYL